MTIGVVNMEVPLTPRGVHRRGGRREPGGNRPLVHGIHVIHPEHDAAPDLAATDRSQLEVEEPFTAPEAGERLVRPAVEQPETERLVEGHRYLHAGGNHRYRAETLDRPAV